MTPGFGFASSHIMPCENIGTGNEPAPGKVRGLQIRLMGFEPSGSCCSSCKLILLDVPCLIRILNIV